MRCGRMRCGDIWRCGGKRKQPQKPAFNQIDFWGYGDALVGQSRGMGIYCYPGTVDDEPIITIGGQNVRLTNLYIEQQEEQVKIYRGEFDILQEGQFSITVTSKNDHSIGHTTQYYAATPVQIETFEFDEPTIDIPSGGVKMTTASYTPEDAYVWQGVTVRDEEVGDTYASVYNGWGGSMQLLARSYAPEGATRTLVARHFDEPVGTAEADIVENVPAESAELTEHSITMTMGNTHTFEVTNVSPAGSTTLFDVQPNDRNVLYKTGFMGVGTNGEGTTTVRLIDSETGVEYDTCEVTVEAPGYPTIEFVDGDTNINVGETGTLRFRYTDATGFSDYSSAPQIANITGLRSDDEYCYVTYAGTTEGASEIQCIAWNGDYNVAAGVQVNVIGVQPTNPVIELLSADTNIAVGEYGTARFTITNSNSQSVGVDDYNIVDSWAAGRVDQVYEYTYVGVSEGTTNVYVSARNDGGSATYPIAVTVGATPALEPITAISQFSTDYYTEVGYSGGWNLGTVTPSQNADASSVTFTYSEGITFNNAEIVNDNELIAYLTTTTAGDLTLQGTLQNGDVYTWNFHVTDPTPQEVTSLYNVDDLSMETGEHGNYGLGAYEPFNANTVDGITIVSSNESVVSVGANSLYLEDGWLLGRISAIGEGTATITITLPNSSVYVKNVTVTPGVVDPFVTFVSNDGLQGRFLYDSESVSSCGVQIYYNGVVQETYENNGLIVMENNGTTHYIYPDPQPGYAFDHWEGLINSNITENTTITGVFVAEIPITEFTFVHNPSDFVGHTGGLGLVDYLPANANTLTGITYTIADPTIAQLDHFSLDGGTLRGEFEFLQAGNTTLTLTVGGVDTVVNLTAIPIIPVESITADPSYNITMLPMGYTEVITLDCLPLNANYSSGLSVESNDTSIISFGNARPDGNGHLIIYLQSLEEGSTTVDCYLNGTKFTTLNVNVAEVPVAGLTTTRDTINDVGSVGYVTLASYYPANANTVDGITYSSADPSIAEVVNIALDTNYGTLMGDVRTYQVGTTTLTITIDGTDYTLDMTGINP